MNVEELAAAVKESVRCDMNIPAEQVAQCSRAIRVIRVRWRSTAPGPLAGRAWPRDGVGDRGVFASGSGQDLQYIGRPGDGCLVP